MKSTLSSLNKYMVLIECLYIFSPSYHRYACNISDMFRIVSPTCQAYCCYARDREYC